jgi:prepilin-type processing-associated H-X9-DG protein
MNANKGLTRADAVIAVACIALVLAQAGIINAGGRERTKLDVCLANLRSLAAAWQTYSGNNSGKIPVGDVYYSWTFPTVAYTGVSPVPPGPQLAWTEFPHPFPHSMPPTVATNYIAAYTTTAASQPADVWQHAIAEGTLWKYVGDYNIYRCPDGDKGAYVTYSMPQSMATYPGAGGSSSAPAPQITLINQITRPAERFVFLDTGVVKGGAFFVVYSSSGSSQPGRWYDLPPMRHGQGTTFSFADGHTEYRKWTDPHTLAAASSGQWGGGSIDYCDCDLRWITKVTWGSVPYSCTNPNKHCEY